jgi:crotonobetainyl-CoA:carnitine CoA-transferase CaiB-like acyl-CoA transferase
MKPLDDIRILAIEQFVAGPFGTLHLADLGAEVIKIEDPATGGDVGRVIAPLRRDGDSVYFQVFNRGKSSIGLDLGTAAGREVFAGLVAVSDVVFSNLRADAQQRLGLRYADLAVHNPRIVSANLSAFGRGERQAEPGYDYVLQAESGWMEMTGEPGGPPEKTGLPLVDQIAGLICALSILAAVHGARRSGHGGDCDLSRSDAAMSMLSYPAAWLLNGGFEPARTRHSAHLSIVPFGAFRTQDGWLVVTCAKEHFWRRLASAIGRADLAADPRYADMEARGRNRETLTATLEAVFGSAPTDHWIKRLKDHRVPCAQVRTAGDALADPYCEARGMLVDCDHPHWGRLRLPATAARVGDLRPVTEPAPLFGADTARLLHTLLGIDGTRLADLDAAGAFGHPE